MQATDQVITLISLLIALVAGIGGPLVAFLMGRRQSLDARENARLQVETQLQVATKQVIAPMRQAWINSLRDLIAEIVGKSDIYILADRVHRAESERRSIAVLENRLQLLINPTDKDHESLIFHIRIMISHLDQESDQKAYWGAKSSVMKISQSILKTEWNQTKSGR